MMYGITLVTTARLTSALNCSLSVGEMVDSASSGLHDAEHDHAGDRRAQAVHLGEERRGTCRSSAADFRSARQVNCQPSSEPRQASTASAMMMEPTVGLNICA